MTCTTGCLFDVVRAQVGGTSAGIAPPNENFSSSNRRTFSKLPDELSDLHVLRTSAPWHRTELVLKWFVLDLIDKDAVDDAHNSLSIVYNSTLHKLKECSSSEVCLAVMSS